MSRTARTDGSDLRSCRELLRHLNHPRRLRGNLIARRVLEFSGQDGDRLSDALFSAYIQQAIASALDELPSRRQQIVRRCDIGGERYADVARSLSISERHAFRERDAALRAILAQFVPKRPVTKTRVGSAVDDLWFQVAHAKAMEQNGNWQEALDILERLELELPDADRKCFVAIRLVRLCLEAERFSLAEHHLFTARKLVASDGNRPSWHRAEVDVAAARLADATGDPHRADRLARCACTELRSWADTSAERRVFEALVDGLTLRAEGAFGEGAIAASASFASAAREVVGKSRFLDPQFVIATREAAAMAGWSRARDWRDCERELRACYTLATQAGLTRLAVEIAAHLAGVLRLSGRPRSAVNLLTPLVGTARVVGNSPAALLVYELASSNLDSRALEIAGSYLAELRERAVGSPLRQGYAEFVAAKVHLAQRNYMLALRSAEGAESTLTRMGKDRFVGVSLRLQAEALAGLGLKARALKTIKLAIDMLSAASQTVGLCTAYRVFSRISGDAKYASMARRLLASR